MTVRYYVEVSQELLDTDPPWRDIGLQLIEQGELTANLSRWCLFEDENAPGELNGKKVDLTVTRGRCHESGQDHDDDSIWISGRRVIS